MSTTERAETTRPSEPLDDCLGDLAALGINPSRSGEAYGIVAARTNARWWLTPLDRGAACTRAGLEMFQPVTLAARLVKSLIQLPARIGSAALFPGRRLRLSGTPSFIAAFHQPGLCCSYFTGTDGPHRKTSVQIMNRAGEILGYAKITRNPSVKRYLETEARVLSEVARLELSSAAVPRLVEHQDQGEIAWLVTDSLRAPGHVVAQELGRAHFAFLAELAEKTRHHGAAATYTELEAALDALRPTLDQSWATRLAAGISWIAPGIDILPVSLAHGDFTTWNTFLVEDKLYVFDWEYAHRAYPLGYDQVHFTLSSDLATPAPALLDRLETAIAAAWFKNDRRSAMHAILFALLLHATFYLGRAIEAVGGSQDWKEARRRAELIDAALVRLGR